MSGVALPSTQCPRCGSLLTLSPETGRLFCKNCGFETEYNYEVEAPSESGASATTVETVVFQRQRISLPPIPSYEDFKRLEEEVNKIKTEIEQIKSNISVFSPKIVIIEEKSKEQAKKEVEEYFKEHGAADIEELMLNLKIDVKTLVEIIDELKEEGKISVEEEES